MNFPCPIKIKSQHRQQKPLLYSLFRLHIKTVSWGAAQKCEGVKHVKNWSQVQLFRLASTELEGYYNVTCQDILLLLELYQMFRLSLENVIESCFCGLYWFGLPATYLMCCWCLDLSPVSADVSALLPRYKHSVLLWRCCMLPGHLTEGQLFFWAFYVCTLKRSQVLYYVYLMWGFIHL